MWRRVPVVVQRRRVQLEVVDGLVAKVLELRERPERDAVALLPPKGRDQPVRDPYKPSVRRQPLLPVERQVGPFDHVQKVTWQKVLL